MKITNNSLLYLIAQKNEMKIMLIFNLIILLSITCFGQESLDVLRVNNQDLIIKKQITVDNFESQLKDIPFATVRVYSRYKLASWLWKDGKDETGRAESLTVKAIEELYEYKSEIPDLYFQSLRPKLFALLKVNSEEIASKLSSKYDINFETNVNDVFSILDKNEKLAVNTVINFLANQNELNSNIGLFLNRLQQRKSPELVRILDVIVSLGESGRKSYSSNSLIEIFSYFRDPSIPNTLKVRFYSLVLNTVKRDVQSPNNNKSSSHELLFSTINDISKLVPNLYDQAQILIASLSTRISQERRESIERTERINQNPNKIDAMVSEAEKTDKYSVKYSLYEGAARLALRKSLFDLAIKLIGKTIENEESNTFPPLEFRKQLYNQFLGRLVEKALKKSDEDSVNLAIKKIDDQLFKAKANNKLALYYYEKRDIVSATYAFNEALNLAKQSQDKKKIYLLFQLISTIEKIDSNRISDVVEVTSKEINSIPTLNIDDKPDTINYKNYVTTIMSINWNLPSVMSHLIKKRRNEAVNFADKINKKEVKILAEIVLSTSQISKEEKEAESKTKVQGAMRTTL